MDNCFKCGTEKGLIHHHISYSPENVVMCCFSCHQLLHKKIRRLDACGLSVKEVARLSHNSSAKRNDKKTKCHIHFHDVVSTNIDFRESLRYNKNTGNITWASFFEAKHGKELFEVFV